MRWRVLPIVALFLCSSPAAAQDSGTVPFRFERPIETAGAGPRRLAVDVPLLSGTDPSLVDLRMFDAAGAVVPYILLQPRTGVRQWTEGEVLPIAATEKTSGFEVDFTNAQPIDAVRVAGLRPPFLKRLVLEGSGDRQHWTLLAGEGTLFDLPGEGLRQIDLAFPGGTYRYVRVTWDDRNSGRVPLPASVQARLLAGVVPPPPLTARMGVERRGSEPGRSRYRVKLPAAGLPVVAVDVIVPGEMHVFRQASVRELRFGGVNVQPEELGRGRLMQVARDGVVAGAMRIPIERPSEPELDLVIEDGNNPPLEVTGVSLVFEDLPWIYFEAPGGPITAKYGQRLPNRPAYDLEAVRAGVHIETVPDAAWGAPRRLTTSSDTAPAPAPLPETGPALDPDVFSVRRPLPDGPPVLVALLVDADVLSRSRGIGAQFADVRILDGANRQVPYIVERRDEPLVVPVSLERREPEGQWPAASTPGARSSYLVRLPYTELPASQLVVGTPARVFQRRVELFVQRAADRHHRAPWLDRIAVTTWAHADTDEAASALILPLPRVESSELWLSIDEGDNTTLPLAGARLLLPSYRLRFYRPAGAGLRLAYGRSDLAGPRYDLALLAPQVLGVEAQELAAGAPSADRAGARAEFISHRTFWILLSTAVLVLLGLIARLAKQQDATARP